MSAKRAARDAAGDGESSEPVGGALPARQVGSDDWVGGSIRPHECQHAQLRPAPSATPPAHRPRFHGEGLLFESGGLPPFPVSSGPNFTGLAVFQRNCSVVPSSDRTVRPPSARVRLSMGPPER